MIDIYVLRIMSNKMDYYKLKNSTKAAGMDEKVLAILDDYGKYFDMFPEQTDIDFNLFIPQFKRWHPTMTDEIFNTYVGVLKNAAQPVPDDIRSGISGQLNDLQLGTAMGNLAMQFEAGDIADIFSELGLITDTFRANRGAQHAQFEDMSSIDEFFLEGADLGIKWRLDTLNECMRPLKAGDFGVVAARPDAGKTAFMASESTFLAPQLEPDQNILWLNNEGKAKNLKPRLYQAALNLSNTDMRKIGAGKLITQYRQKMGRIDKIKPIDIHGWNIGQVERLLDDNNPGIVIYDMIDHIKGFGFEARTDLALEAMYGWARERCVKYDCIGLATSQISNEGDGLQFPTLGMLKDSKTGKQGASDFQLMIGKSNDPNLDFQRFLGLPKNKLRPDGKPGDPRKAVAFNPFKARYEDVPIGE